MSRPHHDEKEASVADDDDEAAYDDEESDSHAEAALDTVDVGDKMTGAVCALPTTEAEVEGSEIEKLSKGCVVVVVVVDEVAANAAVAAAGTV